MPVTVKKIKDKFRVVEKLTGNVVKNDNGTAVDGGGYRSEAQAKRQMSAININKYGKMKFE